MRYRAQGERVFGLSQLKQRLGDGLVAHYIRGGSGNTLFDSSGYGNHADIAGTVNWTLGQGGDRSCLNFNGTTTIGRTATSPSLTLTNNFTISFWMKANTLSDGNRYIIHKENSGDSAYGILWEYVNNTIEFYSAFYSGSNPRTGSGIVVDDLLWHHIAYTYDGVTWSGYKDGVAVFSVARTFAFSQTGGNLVIGCYSVGNNVYNGSLDNITIYNKGLSQAQIWEQSRPFYNPVTQIRRYSNYTAAAPVTDTSKFFLMF